MDRYLYSGDSIVGIVPPTEYELELEQRCEQLEQLCKSMYANFGNYAMSHDEHELLSLMDIFTRRMKGLGLLKGEQE